MAKELAIVRHVFHLRRKGKTLRAIAALLNRDRVSLFGGRRAVRVRLLLADGNRAVDFFWLQHTGKDIYYGHAHVPGHFTYHRSGRRHFKGMESYDHLERSVPLAEVHGAFPLVTVAFSPPGPVEWKIPDYSGGKADVVTFLDTRAMLKNRVANIFIGLVEPGRLDALDEFMKAIKSLHVRQVQVVTNVSPWVYVMITST